MSVEGFTCLLVFKNIFSFGLTVKGFDWIVKGGGIKPIFIALGSVQVGICALTIPMCEFSSFLNPFIGVRCPWLFSLRKRIVLRLEERHWEYGDGNETAVPRREKTKANPCPHRHPRQKEQILLPPAQHLLQADRCDCDADHKSMGQDIWEGFRTCIP